MMSQQMMPSMLPSACGNRRARKSGRSVELAGARVTFELGVDVFDEDLAAELLAEEADVAADDRPEIEERRRLREVSDDEQLAQRFGGKQRLVHRRRRRDDASLAVRFAALQSDRAGPSALRNGDSGIMNQESEIRN